MKTEEAFQEISRLLIQLERLGGSKPSEPLADFIAARIHSKLKNSADSHERPKRRNAREQKMAETVMQMTARLRASFDSDSEFETVVKKLARREVTKEGVVRIYNELFDKDRSFPKSMTKSALVDAIRKDRIAHIRAAS
ncbi:MAG: hypothetical protein AAGJ51_05995 [Pseudomonadota bacterium]